jgi:hypothetical protein
MLAFISIMIILIVGLNLMICLAKLGLTIIKAVATVMAYFFLIAGLAYFYGFVMVPIAAFTLVIMFISSVCKLFLRNHRPYYSRMKML